VCSNTLEVEKAIEKHQTLVFLSSVLQKHGFQKRSNSGANVRGENYGCYLNPYARCQDRNEKIEQNRRDMMGDNRAGSEKLQSMIESFINQFQHQQESLQQAHLKISFFSSNKRTKKILKTRP
jgi:hypothetical protein